MATTTTWSTLVSWARKSALGHVALCELIGAPALSLVLLGLFYSDGTLTLSWAIYTVFLSFLCMAASGLLLWFTFTRPLSKRANARAARREP